MITRDQIDEMTPEERLRVMEMLWDALSATADSIDSPDWHRDMLKQTEARVASGQEEPMDWEKAKRDLRSRFE